MHDCMSSEAFLRIGHFISLVMLPQRVLARAGYQWHVGCNPISAQGSCRVPYSGCTAHYRMRALGYSKQEEKETIRYSSFSPPLPPLLTSRLLSAASITEGMLVNMFFTFYIEIVSKYIYTNIPCAKDTV